MSYIVWKKYRILLLLFSYCGRSVDELPLIRQTLIGSFLGMLKFSPEVRNRLLSWANDQRDSLRSGVDATKLSITGTQTGREGWEGKYLRPARGTYVLRVNSSSIVWH